MDGKKYQKDIESDIRYASDKGVVVKPTIFINEYKLIGAQPFENIQRIITQILSKKDQGSAGIQFPAKATDLQNELKRAFEIPSPNLQNTGISTQDSATNH
jgi:hypothetical protein